jgi:hypothetical protein
MNWESATSGITLITFGIINLFVVIAFYQYYQCPKHLRKGKLSKPLFFWNGLWAIAGLLFGLIGIIVVAVSAIMSLGRYMVDFIKRWATSKPKPGKIE